MYDRHAPIARRTEPDTTADRIRTAIRLACSNRLRPVHGSDIQDWVIGLRPGYWACPEGVIADMLRRGLIRRGARMLRQDQEHADWAGGRHMRRDSPFHYWYCAVGLDTTPCEDRDTLLARLRAEVAAEENT